MEQFSIWVAGDPVGKGRPRFTRHGQVYTPVKTEMYENHVRSIFLVKYPGKEPLKKQAVVAIRAYYTVPKRMRKADREALRADSNAIRPTRTPDADNIVKICLDALNGVAYTDDRIITEIRCVKQYTLDSPGVEILITGE